MSCKNIVLWPMFALYGLYPFSASKHIYMCVCVCVYVDSAQNTVIYIL